VAVCILLSAHRAVIFAISQLSSFLSGLEGDAEDVEQRIDKYGVNVIPQKPPPSFLQLCWEAIQDPLLIILSVAAFITIGLSFYEPPPDDVAGKIQGRLSLLPSVGRVPAKTAGDAMRGSFPL